MFLQMQAESSSRRGVIVFVSIFSFRAHRRHWRHDGCIGDSAHDAMPEK